MLVGVLLSVLFFHRAMRLLGSIKTDLINLLPDDYPSVKYTEEIEKKFEKKNSLYMMIQSDHPELNQKAMFAAKQYLEALDDVGEVMTEKTGYDFFDQNKLLLLDFDDLITIHDRLKSKIQKEKLGGLYIDFEESENKQDVNFDDLIKKYKDEFADGVKSRYLTNQDGTVYALNIFPKGNDSSLKFYKKFGTMVQEHMKAFDFASFSPDISYGFAGAIVTRVDQYDALIKDLKKAGLISACSIFLLLYFYYGRFVQKKKGYFQWVLTSLMRLIPVIAIFLPMVFSIILAFAFSSIFFDHLNVVTSFLFAIILGLGVDVGIHLLTRYMQDRAAGFDIDQIHRDIVVRTGKSCAIGILTTVASFYVLTINDFKGFSEFGWIAGHGLIIALLCYLIFFPALILLIDQWGLIRLNYNKISSHDLPSARKWIPFAKVILVCCLLVAALSAFGMMHLRFEWDFGKLNMKFAEREEQKELLKQTHGRVNRPAVYLIDNKEQAQAIKKIIQERKENDPDSPTIQFFRSYYDMFPDDQKEKMIVLKDIKELLMDELVLKSLKPEEKDLVDDFLLAIDRSHPITEKDVPKDVYELFWGPLENSTTSVAYVMPLPHLQLDNGNNAKAFYEDVYDVEALGKHFYAISDAMVFAQVLQTLFKESKTAILLSSLIIFLIISFHFKNTKRTTMVFVGLLCGIFWMLGLMALVNLRLNFYNMIIIPAMIGMGVDNSVHIIHRFDEMKHRSILAALRTSGGAALMASLTTILGYGGLCFTHHPGLFSIGTMAVIGMSTCLVASLLVLPLLLQLFRHNLDT